jgi:hypothetical protein
MAKRVHISMTDDLDGTEGAEAVQFGYDGRTYEIDLTEDNRQELEEFLQRYIDAARRVGGQGRQRSRGRSTRRERAASNDVDRDAVRAWAAEQGVAVAQRGRIAKKVMNAYREAHAA